MRREKKKKESFLTKVVNFVLTIFVAYLIGSQVCTAANNNLRFAVISDAHFSSFEKNTSYKLLENSAELLDDAIFQVNTSGPYDFVMFNGDLVNAPKVSELQKFMEHSKNLIYPWYAIDGNHDISIDGDLTKSKFIEILKSKNKNINNIYYAFSPKKGYRILCLDSIIDNKITTNGEIPSEELEWIANELSQHKKDTIIIFTHVPVYEPFSSSSHRLNNEHEIKKILKNHKNPVIIVQGHYHAAKIRKEDNVLAITTPSLVTYPNAFRVIHINTTKDKVKIDVFLKETNLKEIQTRSKLRVLGSQLLYGEDCDRNNSFELRRED